MDIKQKLMKLDELVNKSKEFNKKIIDVVDSISTLELEKATDEDKKKLAVDSIRKVLNNIVTQMTTISESIKRQIEFIEESKETDLEELMKNVEASKNEDDAFLTIVGSLQVLAEDLEKELNKALDESVDEIAENVQPELEKEIGKQVSEKVNKKLNVKNTIKNSIPKIKTSSEDEMVNRLIVLKKMQ